MGTTPAGCRLADQLLDEGISSFIVRQRAAGRSWNAIARELSHRTKREIEVTGPTVADWADRLGISAQRPEAEKAAS